MKRFLFVFASALLLFNATASAAEVEILSAVKNDEGYVNIKCSVSDAEDNQLITIMAREYSQSEDSANGIIYIDQIKPEISDGEFEYQFNVSNGFDEKTVYLLRVGGTNVDKVAQKIIAVNGRSVYVAGDVNGDGRVDDEDAAVVLKYVSGLVELSDTELKAANISGVTSAVDLTDAIEILKLSKS